MSQGLKLSPSVAYGCSAKVRYKVKAHCEVLGKPIVWTEQHMTVNERMASLPSKDMLYA
jgi:hypothetical protein